MRTLIWMVLIGIVISVPTVAFAEKISSDTDYMEIELPVMSGAYEVNSRSFEELSTRTVGYQLQIGSVESIFSFYDEFFSSTGWKDLYQASESMRGKLGGNWSGYNFTIDPDGQPRATFVRIWGAPEIPVMANVSFEAESFDGRLFSGKVTVTLSPQVDLAPLMSLQSIFSKKPEALFVLTKQVGGNPFDLTDANIAARPDLKDADPIVVEYFLAIDKILESYKLFREKHLGE